MAFLRIFTHTSLTLSVPNFRRHLSLFVVCFFVLTNYSLERRLYVKLIDWMSNSVDPDETAQWAVSSGSMLFEPSHLDLCCLKKPIIITCCSERVKVWKCYIYTLVYDIPANCTKTVLFTSAARGRVHVEVLYPAHSTGAACYTVAWMTVRMVYEELVHWVVDVTCRLRGTSTPLRPGYNVHVGAGGS